ncbi:MAG TPA: hypothetical protein VGG62_17755 [Terracidiphilus sp.]
MIHSLMPWHTLTRDGIPPLKVARRPFEIGEVTVPVGETLNPELFPLDIRGTRLRQFYEQRLLEPVDPQRTMQQYYREEFRRMHGGQEAVIEPIAPVASEIVAGLPAVDAPEVPLQKSYPPMPKHTPPPPRRK